MREKGKQFSVVGVDLAGVHFRPTGICFLQRFEASTSLLYSDEEILDYVLKEKPDLVAIDAPLTLPPGRRSIHDLNDSHFRVCDLELKRRGIPFFPITLGPMRSLTERGIELRRKLERLRIQVIEIYPGGAQDLWRIPRARHGIGKLRSGLRQLGIKGLKKEATAHELDAATGALVGQFFLQGQAQVFGNFATGAIIMPYPRRLKSALRRTKRKKAKRDKKKLSF